MKIGKIKAVSIVNNDYTSVLRHIDVPPKTLYTLGTLPKERRPTVAIVGSRKPTPYGLEVTRRLAYDLAAQGVVIISGLAYGIDAAAHKAALEAKGVTIAILAGGLHRIYPAGHRGLAEDIIRSGGSVLSEQELGVEAQKYHFLTRNRLVSGLADAVIVVEATERSGTLSTVNHALTQNKDVFAVPGAITSLLSVGPNRLLQQGAHVALEASDILAIIAPELLKKEGSQTHLVLGDTPLEVKALELIQAGIRDGEILLKQCCEVLGSTPSEFLQALTMMELKGLIKNSGGNRWTLP